MSQNDRSTSGRGQSGTAGESEIHGRSPKSRRDEKDPNYERRTLPEHDEMPELASWDTQAAGVVSHHRTGEMDREGEQDEDYEDMANEMENEGSTHHATKDIKSPSTTRSR